MIAQPLLLHKDAKDRACDFVAFLKRANWNSTRPTLVMNADFGYVAVAVVSRYADFGDGFPIAKAACAEHQASRIDLARPIHASNPEYRAAESQSRRQQRQHPQAIASGERYLHGIPIEIRESLHNRSGTNL